ncbi:hypothetical protein EJ05DRAFT_486944 [Pseudovirgaria hyperparasitica]|uniref:Zinc finger PHD-type domain-containing protein n=1 Tax=Pseudovirgaria hyperparasitica TaxID=470096 RepID=A0A6A6W2Z9_9PEZI|nr:uncharacterized protein EJ05DRAFT_486944 [Pseudovirgaria hyperparasitica]KAF2756935.1 hypothetical protein EJ05DRAFT_486944 [Pseudovirgaria hyperparasitica]
MSDASPIPNKLYRLALSPQKKIKYFYARGRKHFERRVFEQRSFLETFRVMDGVPLAARPRFYNNLPLYEVNAGADQYDESMDDSDMEIETDQDGYPRVDGDNQGDRLYMINARSTSCVYSFEEHDDDDDDSEAASDPQDNALSKLIPDLDKPLPAVTGQNRSCWIETPENGVEHWRAKLEYRHQQSLKLSRTPSVAHHPSRAEWEEDLQITGVIREMVRHLEGELAKRSSLSRPLTYHEHGCVFIYRRIDLPTGPASCSHPLCRYRSPGHIKSHTKCVTIENVVSNFMLEGPPLLNIANGEIPIYTRDLVHFTPYHRGLIKMWFCVSCLEDLWGRYKDSPTEDGSLTPSTFTSVENGQKSTSASRSSALSEQYTDTSPTTMRPPPRPLPSSVCPPSSVNSRKRASTSTASPEPPRTPRIRLVDNTEPAREYNDPSILGLDGTTDIKAMNNGKTQIYVMLDSSGDEEKDRESQTHIQADTDDGSEYVDVRQFHESRPENNEFLGYASLPKHDFDDCNDLMPARPRTAEKLDTRTVRFAETAVLIPFVPHTTLRFARDVEYIPTAPYPSPGPESDIDPDTIDHAPTTLVSVDAPCSHYNSLAVRPRSRIRSSRKTNTSTRTRNKPQPSFKPTTTKPTTKPTSPTPKRPRYGTAPIIKFASPPSPLSHQPPTPTLWCLCRSPIDGSAMLACAATTCHIGWMHVACLKESERPRVGVLAKGEWVCPVCVGGAGWEYLGESRNDEGEKNGEEGEGVRKGKGEAARNRPVGEVEQQVEEQQVQDDDDTSKHTAYAKVLAQFAAVEDIFRVSQASRAYS